MGSRNSVCYTRQEYKVELKRDETDLSLFFSLATLIENWSALNSPRKIHIRLGKTWITRVSQKFCKILVVRISLGCVYHVTEAVQAVKGTPIMVGSIVVVGALTCPSLLQSMWDLKSAQVICNRRTSLIWELIYRPIYLSIFVCSYVCMYVCIYLSIYLSIYQRVNIVVSWVTEKKLSF